MNACPYCLFEHHVTYLKNYSGKDDKYLWEYDILKLPYFCPYCGRRIESTCKCCGQVVIENAHHRTD